jgi:hypothetical protein
MSRVESEAFKANQTKMRALNDHAKWLIKRKSTPEAEKALLERFAINENEQQSALMQLIHMFPHSAASFPCDSDVRALLSTTHKLESVEYQWKPLKKNKHEIAVQRTGQTLEILRSNVCCIQQISIHGLLDHPHELLEFIELSNATVLDIIAGNIKRMNKQKAARRICSLINAASAVKTVRIESEFPREILQCLRRLFSLEVLFASLLNF